MVNFIIAWQAAVHVTERYLVSESQRKADEEHTKWVDRTLLGQGASQKQRPGKPGQFFLFRLCRVRARPTFRETIPACGSRALASGSASAGSMRVSTGLSLALCQDALQKLFAILFECGLQIVEIATNALRHDCSPSPSSVRILVCL